MCWSDLREFGRLLLERWFKGYEFRFKCEWERIRRDKITAEDVAKNSLFILFTHQRGLWFISPWKYFLLRYGIEHNRWLIDEEKKVTQTCNFKPLGHVQSSFFFKCIFCHTSWNRDPSCYCINTSKADIYTLCDCETCGPILRLHSLQMAGWS